MNYLVLLLSLLAFAASAVEVEPKYNNPTSFEEKAKQTPVEDPEPECD
jgi:hypothetical protein